MLLQAMLSYNMGFFYYSENTEVTSTSIGKTWEGLKRKLLLKFWTGTVSLTLSYFGFQNHIRH